MLTLTHLEDIIELAHNCPLSFHQFILSKLHLVLGGDLVDCRPELHSKLEHIKSRIPPSRHISGNHLFAELEVFQDLKPLW